MTRALPMRSPFGLRLFGSARRPYSRRGHTSVRQIVGNLRVIPREGSIDSVAAAISPPAGTFALSCGRGSGMTGIP
jgi:hypothetical protein